MHCDTSRRIANQSKDQLISGLLLGSSNPGLEAEVVLQWAVVVDVLQVAAVTHDTVVVTGLQVLSLVHVGEAPLLADDDLLATSELVSRSSESLQHDGTVALSGSDGQEDLADVNTSDSVVWLTVGTTHTSLQPIGTSAGQHLVDTDDVEGVNSDSQVERVLTGGLGDVLVGANTGSLESLRGNLLVLVTDHVCAEGEVVYRSLLTSKVIDADLSEVGRV